MEADLEAIWDEAAAARVRDLTLEGAFMVCDAQARTGDLGTLTVVGSAGRVAVRVRVVRTVERGFGVRFLEMDRDTRQAIANHLLHAAAPAPKNPWG